MANVMSDAEKIRGHIAAAAARLDRLEAEWNEALGRQAAYRSNRWWAQGGENSNAGPRPPDDSPPDAVVRWLMTPTPQHEEFLRRRRGTEFESLRNQMMAANAALYTQDFERAVAELRNGRSAGIETAIAFLEADPWHYHSGYLKQKLARWIRRMPLTEQQRERLRQALTSAIQKGRREDLSEYVSLGRTLDTPEFRSRLLKVIETADEGTAYRAQRMLAACQLNDSSRGEA